MEKNNHKKPKVDNAQGKHHDHIDDVKKANNQKATNHKPRERG